MKIIFEARERDPPIIRARLLKRRRREVKVDPMFGGEWKIPCLVVNGRSHAWWPMECEGKHLFTSFNSP
jgi:hypothetical protein